MGSRRHFFSKQSSPNVSFTVAKTDTFNIEPVAGAQNYRGLAIAPDNKTFVAISYAGLEQFNRLKFDVENDLQSAYTFHDDGKWNGQPLSVDISEDGVYGFNMQLGTILFRRNLGVNYNFLSSTNQVVVYGTAIRPDGQTFSQASNYQRGLKFSNDGTKLFINRISSINRLSRYDMVQPYDIQNMSFIQDYEYPEDTNSLVASSVFLNSGSKIIVGQTNGFLRMYDLSTPYDLSTWSNPQTQQLQEGILDMVVDTTQSFLYTIGGNSIQQYSLIF